MFHVKQELTSKSFDLGACQKPPHLISISFLDSPEAVNQVLIWDVLSQLQTEKVASERPLLPSTLGLL